MNFAKKINIVIFLFATTLLTIVIARCTPEKKFHVLSFFFDGVPDPNKKTVVDSSSTVSTAYNTVPVAIVSEASAHPPFEEHKCTSCHAGEFSNALIKPQPYLCYTCHVDFNSKYQLLHGPASSGYCTYCHDPHGSDHKKLLRITGQDLCFQCHEPKQVLKNKKHENIGKENCTECHNPHGGENRSFLKAGTCFNCHENFSNKYNFVHGPVVSGNCSACHDSHSSQKPKLLLRESQQVCLFCHDADLVFKNAAHKKAKKNNCIECHNPHGGEDRFILIEALRPYKTKPLLKTKTDSLAKEKSSVAGKKDSASVNSTVPVTDKSSDSTKEKNNIDATKAIGPTIKDSALTSPANPSNSGGNKTSGDTKEEHTVDPSKNNSSDNTGASPVKYKIPDNAKVKTVVDSIFKKPDPIILIKTEDGMHKYLNGFFYTLEEAIKYRDELVLKGYKDAFVVAYQNGKRVPNSTVNKGPVDSKNNDAVIFRVQVGAFADDHIPENKTSNKVAADSLKIGSSVNDAGKDSSLTKPVAPKDEKTKKRSGVPF